MDVFVVTKYNCACGLCGIVAVFADYVDAMIYARKLGTKAYTEDEYWHKVERYSVKTH